MSKSKKQKYATYLRVAIILYALVFVAALLSVITTFTRPAAPTTLATDEKTFQQQRSEIDRRPVMSLEDLKEYAKIQA